jgi:hypothetical protein
LGITACGSPAPAPTTDLPPPPPVYTPAAATIHKMQDTFKVNSLEDALNRHVALHNALTRDDTYQEKSEELFQYLKQYKSDFFILKENDIKKFNIVMSPDKRLGILNWGWREGSESLYRSVCVFKTNNGETNVLWLSNDSARMGMFKKIWSIPTQDATLYVADANFSQNRHDASFGAQLFQIEGNQLKTPNLFPNAASHVSVEFDVRDIDADKMYPMIEQGGQIVKIPSIDGKYKMYHFDGTRFQLE